MSCRLYRGSSDLEIEWTVGPLTSGMDVSMRVSTDLDSGTTSAALTAGSLWSAHGHSVTRRCCAASRR